MINQTYQSYRIFLLIKKEDNTDKKLLNYLFDLLTFFYIKCVQNVSLKMRTIFIDIIFPNSFFSLSQMSLSYSNLLFVSIFSILLVSPLVQLHYHVSLSVSPWENYLRILWSLFNSCYYANVIKLYNACLKKLRQ